MDHAAAPLTGAAASSGTVALLLVPACSPVSMSDAPLLAAPKADRVAPAYRSHAAQPGLLAQFGQLGHAIGVPTGRNV